MRVLVALGGKALLRRGEATDAVTRRRNVELAASGLAEIAAEHELIVTNGAGLQTGRDGAIDHSLALALRNRLPERDLITVLTEVVVAADDPAFGLAADPVGEPGGAGPKPAPEPRAIVELRGLRVLIEAGVLVICACGGHPIVVGHDGSMRGVEAAVDTDLSASLLARRLDADVLALLTDVAAVRVGWGGAEEVALAETTPEALRAHSFATASMGPKVEAACRFVEARDRRAAIGAMKDAAAVVRGQAGTQIGTTPGGSRLSSPA